ncbi:Response regulator RpfG [Aneurinibacillus migulanus]|nr:Response regulator RpfG [Aneurinibacillus migulanus]
MKTDQHLHQLTMSLWKMLLYHDEYTAKHSSNVATYAYLTARSIGLDLHSCRNLYAAGLLHDIGKIKICSTLLNKPGSLTNHERRQIEQHTQYGQNIISLFKNIDPLIQEAAYKHHERLDGSGYPDGIKGRHIPLFVRILAVADVYDAMTTTRPYQAERSHSCAKKIIEKEANTKFDEYIVSKFFLLFNGNSKSSLLTNLENTKLFAV